MGGSVREGEKGHGSGIPQERKKEPRGRPPASFSTLSPKTRLYRRGGTSTSLSTASVATGSIEEMAEPAWRVSDGLLIRHGTITHGSGHLQSLGSAIVGEGGKMGSPTPVHPSTATALPPTPPPPPPRDPPQPPPPPTHTHHTATVGLPYMRHSTKGEPPMWDLEMTPITTSR